jgi:hypothetical protein
MLRVNTHLMEKHIRYVIDGYTTQRVEDIKKALKSHLTNLDDDIKISKDGYKVSLSFRTPANVRVMQCEEIDELLSKLGVMATRIIVSNVVTYESAVDTEAVSKKLNVNLLIAALSDGKTVERSEGIILSCKKREGKWMQI